MRTPYNYNFDGIVGKRFGKLTALDEYRLRNGKGQFKCQCDCGNNSWVDRGNLKAKRGTKSCGCNRTLTMRRRGDHTEDTLIGTRVHSLLVTSEYRRKGHSIQFKCVCDCGRTVWVQRGNLVSKHTKSCGCRRVEKLHARLSYDDLVSGRFGRLISTGEVKYEKGKGRARCICDCGTERWVVVTNLRRGNTLSCGCLFHDKVSLPPGEAAFRSRFSQYRKAAESRGLSFELTPDEFRRIASECCHYCGAAPANIRKAANGSWVSNGIDRVDSTRGYSVDNCVAACTTCNVAKWDMSKAAFEAWVKRIHAHMLTREEA